MTDRQPPRSTHEITRTDAGEVYFPGMPDFTWSCTCGAGSTTPVNPPTVDRAIREHLIATNEQAARQGDTDEF